MYIFNNFATISAFILNTFYKSIIFCFAHIAAVSLYRTMPCNQSSVPKTSSFVAKSLFSSFLPQIALFLYSYPALANRKAGFSSLPLPVTDTAYLFPTLLQILKLLQSFFKKNGISYPKEL
jgi:hypothetical protein